MLAQLSVQLDNDVLEGVNVGRESSSEDRTLTRG